MQANAYRLKHMGFNSIHAHTLPLTRARTCYTLACTRIHVTPWHVRAYMLQTEIHAQTQEYRQIDTRAMAGVPTVIAHA